MPELSFLCKIGWGIDISQGKGASVTVVDKNV